MLDEHYRLPPKNFCLSTGTNVIEKGWSGYLDKYQNFLWKDFLYQKNL